MICPTCQTLNFRDYKFCRECGQRLSVPRPPLGLDVTRQDLDLGHPQDAQIQALLESAFTAFDEGRLPDARAACQSALALRPDSTAAHSLLGLVCEREGKAAEAIHQFQIVLELNPKSSADQEHLERLQRRRLPRSAIRNPQSAIFRRSPLLVGSIAAAVVMIGGLWLTAGLLQPRGSATSRVHPTNLRVMRGAPGAVSPFAGSLRLPAPATGGSVSPGYPPPTFYPSQPSASVGGVPPTVRMNSRMAALAPAIFGSAGMGAPRQNSLPRPRTLVPAPVRAPRDLTLPGSGPIHRGSVPQLPDPRGEATPTESAPPVQPESSASSPAPEATPPSATREAPEETSGSFIRIRPLSAGEGNAGEGNTGAAHGTPSKGSASVAPSSSSEATPARGPSLAEARLHQQNAFNYWRQGDTVAAYQEYEYAAQLYRLIAGRRGPDAAAASQGLQAAYQGMQASRGRQ